MPDGHSKQLIVPGDSPSTPSANEVLNQLKDPQAYLKPSKPSSLKYHHNNNQSLASHPYSKSHAKRLKKKLRDQVVLVGDLNPVKDALNELIEAAPNQPALDLDKRKHESSTPLDGITTQTNKPQRQKSINQHQRAIILQQESARVSKILELPQFQQNPFAAIRTHAINSLSVQAARP